MKEVRSQHHIYISTPILHESNKMPSARTLRSSAPVAPVIINDVVQIPEDREQAVVELVAQDANVQPVQEPVRAATPPLAADAPEPVTTKKKRGRPPTVPTDEMEEKLVDPENIDIHQFSLTYKKNGAHMPPVWFTCVSEFLEKALQSTRFVNGRERGGKMEHLHGQAVYEAHHGADPTTIKKIVKALKLACGTRHGDGSKIGVCLKELGPGQTMIRMAGYCTKDAGKPHHVSYIVGFTDAEIEIGKAEHASLKLNYMDERIPLNKSNFFSRVHSFVINNPELFADCSDHYNLADIVAMMLNTKKYMIAATMLMTGSGQMRATAAESYLAIIMGKQATYVDVMSILYLPDTRSYTRGLHGGAAPPATFDETPMRVPRGAAMHMGDFVPLTNVEPREAPPPRPPTDPSARRIDDDSSGDDEGPLRSTFERIRQVVRRIRRDSDSPVLEDEQRSEENSEAHASDDSFINDEDDEEAGNESDVGMHDDPSA